MTERYLWICGAKGGRGGLLARSGTLALAVAIVLWPCRAPRAAENESASKKGEETSSDQGQGSSAIWGYGALGVGAALSLAGGYFFAVGEFSSCGGGSNGSCEASLPLWPVGLYVPGSAAMAVSPLLISSRLSDRHLLPVVATGALLAAGAGFVGYGAGRLMVDGDAYCPGDSRPCVRRVNSAESGWINVAVGGGLVAAGGVLWWYLAKQDLDSGQAPNHDAPTVSLMPTLSGAALVGTF